MNIREIIKEANQAQFTPSQRAFDLAAKTFVHQASPVKQPKIGAVKGRYKRHRERLARGVKSGFGKGYSAPEVVFRVEFAWCDEDGEEDEW